MTTYRVDIAFYVEAESADKALITVENGINAKLSADYDLVDVAEY